MLIISLVIALLSYENSLTRIKVVYFFIFLSPMFIKNDTFETCKTQMKMQVLLNVMYPKQIILQKRIHILYENAGQRSIFSPNYKSIYSGKLSVEKQECSIGSFSTCHISPNTAMWLKYRWT